MCGWIKLHRKMLEWEWYSDTNVCRVFVHLILKANYKDGRYKGHPVKRGQVISGRNMLSQETGLTPQQIRTAINKLKSTNEITSQTTSQFTIYTIENYGNYQVDEDGATNQTTSNPTSEQPASNQRATTSKERKKEKKEKKIIKEKFELPSIINEELFEDYVEMRKATKSPMTDKAKKMLVKKIGKLVQEGNCPDKLLETAIISNWKSVYPTENTKQGANYETTQRPSARTNQGKAAAVAATIARLGNEG